jgi:hypothetical protein
MPKGSGVVENRAKVKFRFIEFELEGGNAAVENSVRNLTTALTRNTGNNGLKAWPSKTPAALPSAAETQVLDPQTIDNDEPETIEPEIAEAAASSAAKVRTPRKPSVPELIADLDPTTGDIPLKEFCASKTLALDTKKCLACAVWLKEHKQIPVITDGHVYTCFKFMKWQIPVDIGAVLRGMKKQNWFTTPERGKFAITHLGENEVTQMG